MLYSMLSVSYNTKDYLGLYFTKFRVLNNMVPHVGLCYNMWWVLNNVVNPIFMRNMHIMRLQCASFCITNVIAIMLGLASSIRRAFTYQFSNPIFYISKLKSKLVFALFSKSYYEIQ